MREIGKMCPIKLYSSGPLHKSFPRTWFLVKDIIFWISNSCNPGKISSKASALRQLTKIDCKTLWLLPWVSILNRNIASSEVIEINETIIDKSSIIWNTEFVTILIPSSCFANKTQEVSLKLLHAEGMFLFFLIKKIKKIFSKKFKNSNFWNYST
jgi:hypothetical protein